MGGVNSKPQIREQVCDVGKVREEGVGPVSWVPWIGLGIRKGLRVKSGLSVCLKP